MAIVQIELICWIKASKIYEKPVALEESSI